MVAVTVTMTIAPAIALIDDGHCSSRHKNLRSSYSLLAMQSC
jgi:hypothetical protein